VEVPKDVIGFYAKEHEYLVAELEARVQETRKLELAVIGGAPAIWAWLATHSKEISSANIVWPWWIPFFLAVLAGVRCWMLFKNIKRKSVYIKELEKILRGDGPLQGWRNHRASVGKKSVTTSAIVLWTLLILLTGLLPFMAIKP
jgi:hypothetical protein